MVFLSELEQITDKKNIICNEPMAGHTTLRTGGPAKYFVTPENTEQVAAIVKLAVKAGISYYVTGNGSNLLISDEGYDGMIICIGKNMSGISVNGKRITAGAGAMLSSIASQALKNGLAGFEFAAGIPGTAGGACVMNAGAYGGEIKDVIKRVTAVDGNGDICTIYSTEMKMSYRRSVFSEGGYIITETEFGLEPGSREKIQEKMSDFSKRRMEKQPLEFPSAGSTFKRPEGNYAGALIEAAGLKGKGIGDACVSEKHAGFVINRGNATAQDVYATINLVTETVKNNSGIVLEPEVRIIGNFIK